MTRLVEVWSASATDGGGRSGSGWVVGARGVLTCAHVVGDSALVQVRDAHADTPDAWVDAEICWEHATLDIALLNVVPAPGQRWTVPVDASPRLADIGTRAMVGEAVGFPKAAARTDGLRRADRAPGRLLPTDGARDSEGLVSFDVDASVPDDARLWAGFSGAAVLDEHERLVAVVVKVHPARQRRRLLVLAVASAAVDEGFAHAAALVGLDAVVEDRRAPMWRAAVSARSLAPAGVPVAAGDVEDLGVFGVHAAVAADTGSDAYARYVKRDKDTVLGSALASARDGGPPVVLVVGDSAAGKSRSAAQAVRLDAVLSARALVVALPAGGLARLLDAGVRLDSMVVWLDDLDKHLAGGLDHEVLHRLLREARGVVVVATIRRSQLLKRQDSLTDPAWDFLTNGQLVQRVDLSGVLESAELERARAQFSSAPLLAALERGVGLGEYLVGGPELVKRLDLASGLDEHLAQTVIAWYRTGLQHPISEPQLRRLWTETMPRELATRFQARKPADQDRRFGQACTWVCHPIADWENYDDVSLVTDGPEGYEASDYIVDHVSRQPHRVPVAAAVWDAALAVASSESPSRNERLWRVSVVAHDERQQVPALSAMQTLAGLGDVDASINVGVLLGQLGRSEEALVVYDDVIARYADAPEPALREQVARALFNKGARLGQLGRSEEELVVYDDVIARYADAPEPALREQVARARVNKGARLGQLGRSEEELVVYDDVIARYADAPEPALREQVARALFNKGVTLGQLGRSEEELVVYDDVIARYADAPEPALREQVARARVNKGARLGQLGRSEEELVVYDDVIARYADAPEPALREQVARALFNKGARLGQLGRSEEELVVYDDVIARYADAPEPALREQVARALFNKGARLGQLGRSEEALVVYDDVIARYADAPEPALREQVARALFNKGARLGQLGRSEEELVVYDDVIARYADAPEPALREQVARALFNKGVTLGQLGRSEEELVVYDDVIARYADAPEPALREQVASALFNKGATLGQLGRSEEALVVYDDVIARYADAPEPALREQVARALFNKGARLGQLGRSEEALVVYDDVIARYADAPEPILRQAVAMAREAREQSSGGQA